MCTGIKSTRTTKHKCRLFAPDGADSSFIGDSHDFLSNLADGSRFRRRMTTPVTARFQIVRITLERIPDAEGVGGWVSLPGFIARRPKKPCPLISFSGQGSIISRRFSRKKEKKERKISNDTIKSINDRCTGIKSLMMMMMMKELSFTTDESPLLPFPSSRRGPMSVVLDDNRCGSSTSGETSLKFSICPS